jgi:hypothetical protein
MVTQLLSPLILLAAGGAWLAVAALRRPTIRWQHLKWATVAVLGLGLALWLIWATGNGPLWEAVRWSNTGANSPTLALQGNRAGRLIGLALLAVALASVLSMRHRQEEETNPGDQARDLGLMLAALAAALTAFLPANLLTLALVWTAIDGIMAVIWLLSAAEREAREPANVLLNWGAGAMGTLLLWSAVLSTQGDASFRALAEPSGTGGWAATALLGAVLLRLAPFPFHLGRPLPTPGTLRYPALNVSLQIVPLATSAWLLARVPSWAGIPTVWQQILTALLLTGLVGSGLVAWLPSEKRRTVRWIISGHAGLVALVALWVGPRAALAEGLILILVGGLIGLLARLERVTIENQVAAGLGILAMAGIPMTWGGDSRPLLFETWQTENWGLYLFLAAGAYVLLLGAAGRLVLAVKPASPDWRTRVPYGVGLGVLALGLVLRGGSLPQAGVMTWLAILLPLPLAGALAWEAESLRWIQDEVEQWLSPVLSLRWLRQLAGKIGDLVGRAFHAIHEVPEAEGTLLWVLVVLALGWLLTTQQG